MRVPVISGIYADVKAELRTSYPRNLVPVPKDSGISAGYLRPGDGLKTVTAGPGTDRGGINWQGRQYRVMGTRLVLVTAGIVSDIGDVGPGGRVSMDYSFNRLAIASGGFLYYYDGATLAKVTDPDLGYVADVLWVDGYFMTTDGKFIVVADLNDPFQVNPLRYGSSEADPDDIKALKKLRNEVYAFNRYTTELFDNQGGTGFPFARIEAAQIPRGAIGTHMVCLYNESIAFVGSARNEPPAVYLVNNGAAAKVSTREIEESLMQYGESILGGSCVLEARSDRANQFLYLHLPDKTWVYDQAASVVLETPVWFELGSGIFSAQYRARNWVWCEDKWTFGDPQSANLGTIDNTISTHYGQQVGWEFGTRMLYNEGKGFITHALELIALTGRVAFGKNPTIWTSRSTDGVTWGEEFPKAAGKIGERNKRIQWRRLGMVRTVCMQKFRGTSDAHISISALEAELEPLT